MRGAKAKALRRIAEQQAAKLGITAEVDHRAKIYERIVGYKDGQPIRVQRATCVLGPCIRDLYHRAKKKFAGPVPLVGAIRLQRRLMADAYKNMEIIPIDPPPDTAPAGSPSAALLSSFDSPIGQATNREELDAALAAGAALTRARLASIPDSIAFPKSDTPKEAQ